MSEEINNPKSSEGHLKIFIKDSNQEFEVPIEGSLGLLALGAVGLKAWREKKKSVRGNQKEK